MTTKGKDSIVDSKYDSMFEKKFAEKFSIEELEEFSKRLDDRFNVLIEFTRESERSNCDILLFKNAIFYLPYRDYKEIWLICKMNYAKFGMLFKF